MRYLILRLAAGAFIIAAAAYAREVPFYAPGEVIVEFADAVNVGPRVGLKGCGVPGLERLAEKYEVYASEPVFDLPTRPVIHPGGLWTWDDLQTSIEKLRLKYFYCLKYRAKEDPQVVAADYGRIGEVLYAGPNHIGRLCYHPNDMFYGEQWYLYNPANRACDIHAPEGWDMFIFAPPGGEGVYEVYRPRVAVVDSGVWMAEPNYNTIHNDIRANVTQGRDIIDQDDYPEDIFGHGTAISGIACAEWNNNHGIAGIGKDDTLLMPVRITHEFEEYGLLFEKAAAGGIVWAVNNGADVINMSWGFPPNVIPITVVRAVEHAWSMNVNTVAASGNYATPTFTYPGSEERQLMITAGGSKRVPVDWERWEYSNYFRQCVDVIAPASPDIFVTWLNNG